jgi:hypothetical protein
MAFLRERERAYKFVNEVILYNKLYDESISSSFYMSSAISFLIFKLHSRNSIKQYQL